MARREQNTRANLTEGQRREIVRLYEAGARPIDLSAQFGISQGYPCRLARIRGAVLRTGHVEITIRLRADVAERLRAASARSRSSVPTIACEAIAAYVGASEQ